MCLLVRKSTAFLSTVEVDHFIKYDRKVKAAKKKEKEEKKRAKKEKKQETQDDNVRASSAKSSEDSKLKVKLPRTEREWENERWKVRITIMRSSVETLYNPYKYRW